MKVVFDILTFMHVVNLDFLPVFKKPILGFQTNYRPFGVINTE